MKREGTNRVIILIVAIVLVLGGAGVLIATYVRTDVVSELAAAEDQLSILLVIDTPERLVTQVVYLDTGTSRAALFDIPASTGVVVQSVNRVDGIDTVLATGGIESYRQAVSQLVGAPVDFHLMFDPDSLELITDILEGIPLFVADIPDFGPDALRIPSGDVILDGAQMQQYVSFAPEGERDRERIARAQKAVAGLLGRIGQNSDLVSDRVASALVLDAVETNFERQALVSLSTLLAGLELDRIITRQIEGTIREVETDKASELLLFPHQEGRWLQESVRQVLSNLETNESLRDDVLVTLEILNGTSNSGLARRTAELYESYGFDVVTIGNAARDDVGETLVIDRIGNEIFANRTAEIIRAGAIELDVVSGTGVDVTIVLGEDFDGRYVR